jgi:hypothetical protein
MFVELRIYHCIVPEILTPAVFERASELLAGGSSQAIWLPSSRYVVTHSLAARRAACTRRASRSESRASASAAVLHAQLRSSPEHATVVIANQHSGCHSLAGKSGGVAGRERRHLSRLATGGTLGGLSGRAFDPVAVAVPVRLIP